MRPWLAPLCAALVFAGCSAPPSAPTVATVPTATVQAIIPTVGRTPNVSPDVAAGMAERYVRALYANDPTTMKALYPFAQVDQRPQEADWQAQSVAVQPIAPSDAGDKDPSTRYTWTRVLVTTPQGQYRYDVGVMPGQAGQPVVNAILRSAA